MPFRDRAEAGRQLAAKLQKYANDRHVVVLALTRGGVPVGYEVAAALGVPLDAIVVRRLVGRSDHQEVTIGAVASGGVRVVDQALCDALGLSVESVRETAERAQAEVERCEGLYDHDRPRLDVRGRTVILVDDGIATGASMRAAVLAVEARRPASIVVAVPVTSYAGCAGLRKHIAEIEYSFVHDPVYSVSLWYEAYAPVADDDVRRLLERAGARASLPEFSPEHYRELGAEETAVREKGFEERGFPATGPELGNEDREPEPRQVVGGERWAPARRR